MLGGAVPHTTDNVTFLIRDTDAEALWFRDTLLLIRISGEQTGGRFAVIEALAPRGSAAPRHTQPHAESFLILEGEMDHFIDDETMHAGPGRHRPRAGGNHPRLPRDIRDRALRLDPSARRP
jgi:quercetin dioxygenase-like cupin family protein